MYPGIVNETFINFKNRVFKLFQVNLKNLQEIEFHLCFKCHLTISDFDNMEYYRMQYFVQNYTNYLEEKKKQEEQQNNNGRNQKDLFKTDPGALMKNATKSMSGNTSMPKLNFPKL